jgi:hypothetical protein
MLVSPDVCNAPQLFGAGDAGSASGKWGGLELPRLADWKHYIGLRSLNRATKLNGGPGFRL